MRSLHRSLVVAVFVSLASGAFGQSVTWKFLPFFADSDWPAQKGSPATTNGTQLVMHGQPVRTIETFTLPARVSFDLYIPSVWHLYTNAEMRVFFIPPGLPENLTPSTNITVTTYIPRVSANAVTVHQNNNPLLWAGVPLNLSQQTTNQIVIDVFATGQVVYKINGQSFPLPGNVSIPYDPFQIELMTWQPGGDYRINNFSVSPLTDSPPPLCVSVTGNSAAGVSAGNVVAGQTYVYQASGAVGIGGGCQSTPDGLPIGGASCGSLIADADFTCSPTKAWSLIAKINGGNCLQLGSSGSFIAPASGPLVLYFNDDNYTDNSGSYSVCIDPVSPATANSWVSSVSNKWETSSDWSLGTAPGTSQFGQFITNDTSKTVTIDANTVGDAASSMTVSNVTISGPATITNTLVLANSASVTPLRVSNALQLDPGGELRVTNGSVVVDGPVIRTDGDLSILAGAALVATNSIMTVTGDVNVRSGSAQLGAVFLGDRPSRVGSLKLENGTLSIRRTLQVGGVLSSGEVWMTSGQLILSNDFNEVGLHGAGSFTVSNGTVLATSMYIGYGLNGAGKLHMAGGSLTSPFLRLGMFPESTGTVWVTGGNLNGLTSGVEVGRSGQGRLFLSNGIITASSLIVGVNAAPGTNLVVMTGGVLGLTNAGGTASLDTRRGTFTASGGSAVVDNFILNNAAGRFVFSGGSFKVKTATIANGQTFVVGNATNAAIWQLNNGTHSVANSMLVSSNSTLTGSGTISGSVASGGVFSPGTSAGRLTIGGNLALLNSSKLTFELGGYPQGTGHDYVPVGGVGSLAGKLEVSVINNFHGSMTNGASFVILSANPLAGNLANVADGGHLLTTDGFVDFVVTYSGNNLILGNLVLIDDDLDGMPNWYEVANGFDPNDPNDAVDDEDEDGLTNVEEFTAGTDPFDPASVLKIVQIGKTPSGAAITFTSVAGKKYRLEFVAVLGDEWETVQDNISGTGSPVIVPDTSAPNEVERFYRVVVE